MPFIGTTVLVLYLNPMHAYSGVIMFHVVALLGHLVPEALNSGHLPYKQGYVLPSEAADICCGPLAPHPLDGSLFR